jgi:hypothetical protein
MIAIFAMRLLEGHCSGFRAQQPCEIFWLQDHSEVTWSRQSGKWWEGLGTCSPVGGTVGSRSCGDFDWALSLPESAPWSFCQDIRSAGDWMVAMNREPRPVSLWGDLIPAPSPAGRFCKFLSRRLRWLGVSRVLTDFGPGQGAPVQSPQTPYGTWLPFQSFRLKEILG